MIIKTLFLASCMLASALASGVKSVPYPAALLVESNFDYSLIREELRVHYGGLKAGSSPTEVSIKIYKPDGREPFTYKLVDDEKQSRQAFHFALDDVQGGKYEVAVCEDGVCSEKAPSLTDVTLTKTHTLSCKTLDTSDPKIDVDFISPVESDWAKATNYTEFSEKIQKYRKGYQTDNEKYGMNGANPFYDKTRNMFHTAIMHNLKQYEPFFKKTVNEYCGRKYMLSLHSHIVDTDTKKVLHRSKTVNHLSQTGIELFIRGTEGLILLESTHDDVDLQTGKTYAVWVSLCVTDKDTVDSTYCASPIKKDLTV